MVENFFYDSEKLKELEDLLLIHSYKMSILKEDAPTKKKEAILDSLIISVLRAEITLEQVKECIEDVNRDLVINIEFFKKGGNIKDYINPKWFKFAMSLWRQRSVGLGTPNAASGEGELMFLFLSKSISKPTRGDLEINNSIIELKGEGVRVIGDITGKDFRRKTLSILPKYNLEPNKANRTDLDAVEIEKIQQFSHWRRELSKLTIIDQKKFILDWLKCLDNNNHDDIIDKIFPNNNFNHTSLIKELVKILYASMVDRGNFDTFILLGDGSDSKVLSRDKGDFNKKVDEGQIILESDYFRINQSMNIGWYIV